MKKYVKILSLISALLIAVLCSGCGKKSMTAEEGKLIMATNAEFPPYEYYEGDKVVGIDAEVAALIAEKLGLELEIADVAFDSIIPGVQSGKYDMGMAGMTVNDERLEKVNFSTSYAKGIQAVIVKEVFPASSAPISERIPRRAQRPPLPRKQNPRTKNKGKNRGGENPLLSVFQRKICENRTERSPILHRSLPS